MPRGVVSGLKELTDKDYQHRYYVDGSPMTGDIKDDSEITEDKMENSAGGPTGCRW